jgi:hypothetical protein
VAAPGVDVATRIATGPATHVIIEASAEAALLVIGRHDTAGLADRLAGSSTAQIAQFAGCPTVVVPETGVIVPIDGPGVVVGVDIGEYGQPAIELAFDEAVAARPPAHGCPRLDPAE